MVGFSLQQVANDMAKQIGQTNRAYERRIWETKDAKTTLESQVKDVVKLINSLEENIKNVEKTILDKENFEIGEYPFGYQDKPPSERVGEGSGPVEVC